MEEKKQEILELLGKISLAVLNDDIPEMVHLFDKIKISERIGSPLLDLCKDIIIKKLSSNLSKSGVDKFVVMRKGCYGESFNDFYTLENGVLYRNRKPAKWSSVGKLYQAYMAIEKNVYADENINS